MTIRIPNAAEESFLDLMLAENMTLRLFTNDVESGLTEAQKEALTAASFTEATFTGYASKALTGGSWTTTQGDDFSVGTYAAQVFTRTSTGTAQAIRGYYVTRTTGGALRWYEYFPGPITVTANGDQLQMTPTFQLDDTQEATVNARGVIARQSLATNNGPHTTSATTDMALNNVSVDSSRLYAVHLQALASISTSADWQVNFHVDGTLAIELGRLHTLGGAGLMEMHLSKLWEPATSTSDLDIRIVEQSGTSSLSFFGGGTLTRQFWIEDVGPR